METADLIKALAADTRPSSMPIHTAWRIAAIAAILLAGLTFVLMLGPRPDLVDAMGTIRFPFKFVVTLSLAGAAFAVLEILSRPAGNAAVRALFLLVAPALLIGAIVLELLAIPSSQWMARLIGTNSVLCLTFIPLIGIGPLAVLLVTLRYGAPTHPVASGAVAGLMAGALAATFYAAHCPDDSPLFVAAWYTLAIAGLALTGAVLAPRLTRW